METIGQRLKRLRELKGLSQAELAKRVGLKSQGAIGNIERDMRGYGASIVEIARELGTTPDYLQLRAGTHEVDRPDESNAWRKPAWPFPGLSEEKMYRLKRDDALRLEGAILIAAGQLGIDIKSPPEGNRIAA